MIEQPVYLDNNATTRCDPRVVEAMLPFFTEQYGNAGSRHHRLGRAAHAAVEIARGQVAALMNADEDDVFFTSGATESNNLALKGAAPMARRRGNHLVTCQIEHHAVLDVCKSLQRDGWDVTVLPVDRFGQVAVEQVAAALTPRTALVSIMLANNEIGVLQPIAEIGRLCRQRGILLHTDATQGAGKVPIDVDALGVGMLSLSAHKFYGPKGVGALFIRGAKDRPLLPLFDGGGQEGGIRSGTLPVPLVVGLGMACELSAREMAGESRRLVRLRDRLHHGIAAQVTDVHLNGHPHDRLPGTVNLTFGRVRADALMFALEGVIVSPGSACTSASPAPSHVLKAIGLSDEHARASIRFSLGRYNSLEEIDWVVSEVVHAVRQLRGIDDREPLPVIESVGVTV